MAAHKLPVAAEEKAANTVAKERRRGPARVLRWAAPLTQSAIPG
jgi:hypothetical protein